MEYRYINHDELVQLIRSGQAGKDYQVVDVRGQPLSSLPLPTEDLTGAFSDR